MPLLSPPAQQIPDLSPLIPWVQLALSCLGAYLVAVTLALVIWTLRDVRARTRDVVAVIFAPLLGAVFSLPGLIVYLLLRPRETLAEAYERSLEEEYLLQDIEDAEICRSCKRRVQADFMFCPHCRARLRRECEGCGQPMSLRWVVCPYCGRPAPAPARVEVPAPAPAHTTPIGALPATPPPPAPPSGG